MPLSSSASAYTLNDNYYGGLNFYNNGGPGNQSPGPAADVIGSADFNIMGINASRTAQGDLQIQIYTNFAGLPGTPAADGTNYGSIFFGSAATWNSATERADASSRATRWSETTSAEARETVSMSN